jgi:tRNA (guanine-N7-)-methyltransferase
MTGGPGAGPGSFHGRRKGKRLRPGHDRLLETLLPRLRVPESERPRALDPQTFFPDREVWLEIGFGGGEHLLHQARLHPEIGFIGCEPFVNGMAKLLAAMAKEGHSHLRLWDRDASELLAGLRAGSISRVDLLFPDPWPKRRQRKRRFVSDTVVAELARVLRPGAEFRFATDIDDYAGWTLARLLRSPDFAWAAAVADDWRRPWPDWPGTRYEAKAREAGRPAAYLTFRRL